MNILRWEFPDQKEHVYGPNTSTNRALIQYKDAILPV